MTQAPVRFSNQTENELQRLDYSVLLRAFDNLSAQSAKQAAEDLLITAHQLDNLISGFELYQK